MATGGDNMTFTPYLALEAHVYDGMLNLCRLFTDGTYLWPHRIASCNIITLGDMDLDLRSLCRLAGRLTYHCTSGHPK